MIDDEMDDEDNIAANNLIRNNIFDEKRLFVAPSFPEKVLYQAKEQIYRRLEGPLCRLEKEGHELLSQYQRERRDKVAEEKEKEARMIQKNLDDLLIKGDPREYQRLLLEIALSRNTIVNLGTGAGKTLIALLCIKEKHVVGKGKKKKTLFVVPSVALAIQQSFTLRSNLPNFRIETACYATASSKRAREKFADCDVLCATHGAILDLLIHWGDIISLKSFHLVVIDECHYACGDHPYNQLMTKFYHTLPPKERPHILGLTASPVLNLKETYTDEQLLNILDNLEASLDATLVSASGLTSSNSSEWRSREIQEEQVEFRRSNHNRSIPSAKNSSLLTSRWREFKQLEDLYENLGPLVLQVYCQVLSRELSQNCFESETPIEYKEARKYLSRVEEFCKHEVGILPAMGRTDKLLALEQLVEDLIEDGHGGSNAIGLVFVERRITAMALHCYFQWWRDHRKISRSWLPAVEARSQLSVCDPSPREKQKVRCDDCFSDSSDDLFCSLQEPGEIPESDSKVSNTEVAWQEKTVVNSVALVRNPTQIFNSLSISQKHHLDAERQHGWIHKESKLRDTLKRLRDGDTNLLFATSVVEEGVDVQSCSFVVALDGIPNIKSYIQMKGRARQRNAKFFLLHDPKSDGDKLALLSAQRMENRVQDLILERMKGAKNNVAGQRIANRFKTTIVETSQEVSAIEQGFYKAEDASVDLQSAKSLLHRYFLSIPIDPYVRSRKETLLAFLPIFTDNHLELPPHLPHQVRSVILPKQYKDMPKREKEKILSLMACVRLHRHGLLNERLLPLSANDINKKIVKALPLRETVEAKRICDTVFGDSFGQIYVYPVKQDGHGFSLYEEKLNGQGHRLGIVTLQPLKSVFDPICVSHKEFGVMRLSLQKPISNTCSRSQWKLLQKVFSLLLNFRWSRRGKGVSYQARAENERDAVIPSYTIGILSNALTLDWKMMTTLMHESERSEDERRCSALQTAGDSFLARPRIWTSSYSQSPTNYVVFKATGRFCGATFPRIKEGVLTFTDYFEKNHAINVSDDEPLFEAQYMWTSHSAISMPQIEFERLAVDNMPSFTSVELPPSVCLEAPLANAHIALLTVFLPQLLYVFERHQTTEAFIRHSEQFIPALGTLCRKLAHEKVSKALTAKSSNLDENYEKLEWLGDAVLKLLQTDSLVKSGCLKDFFHFLHEGNLSMLRASMGTNKRLQEICVKLGLDRFVLGQSLSRGNWAPSPFEVQRLDSAGCRHQLQTKCHADILEALLGLIYVEFGYDACMKIGNELGLSLLWEEKANVVAKTDIHNGDLLSAVQKCTGYNAFIQPSLFEEALSHPSAIDSAVPSYQRLEWIGDAVACLCAREWLFRRCGSELALKDLVMMEDAVVSNETFGWLSMKYGLPHLLNHRDHTLPGRIESYVKRVQDGSGFWNTDPPKTIADITESVLGAIHMDSNFEAGQAAAVQMLDPTFRIVDAAIRNATLDSLLRIMRHPKRSLQEFAGEILDLHCFPEATFAVHTSDGTHILAKGHSRPAARDGSCNVATVSMLDSILVAVADESVAISSNQAAFTVAQALQDNPLLLQRIEKCQANVARGSFLRDETTN